jgi:hypothetical protein
MIQKLAQVSYWWISILLLLGPNLLKAQEFKRGLIWTIGFTPFVKFEFKNEELPIIKLGTSKSYNLFVGNSCISDTNGNLLFTQGGFTPIDASGDSLMLGREFVNSPFGNKFYDDEGGVGLWIQMCTILPKQGNQYYVITGGMSDFAYDQWKSPKATIDSARFDFLAYHIVDMDSNNGRGKVISKNNILIKDADLSYSGMSAVRHGNGKDWWIIRPHRFLQKMYIFLATADKIILYDSSYIPNKPTGKEYIDAQTNFSNDGTQFAFIKRSYDTFFNYYNFDRCSGQLSNYRQIYKSLDTNQVTLGNFNGGIAFSPDGKFIYTCTNYTVWQYEVANLNEAPIQVGWPDTAINYFQLYNTLTCGPDGRIYVGNFGGTSPTMSYIDKPNNKGLACNFVPRGLRSPLPYPNLKNPPNNPNFALGAWVGSACDTIRPQASAWLLYPNPANNNIKLKVPSSSSGNIVAIKVYNMLGQQIINTNASINFEHEASLPLNYLASGVYVLKAQFGKEEFVGRFLVR